MEDARVVDGRRLEADGERLVLVVAGKVEQLGAACMAHDEGLCAGLRDVLRAQDGEVGKRVAGLKRRRGVGRMVVHGRSQRSSRE